MVFEMNPYMNGTTPRPADLEWFINVLATHHKLSSQEQQLLDDLVLSRDVKEKDSFIAELEEKLRELQEEDYNWETRVIGLSDQLEEAECRIEGLEELEHQVKQREWEELLDQLKRNSSPPSSARQC